MASVLLCLIAAFAISPPEAFYRTQSGNRNRANRMVRLDDHDHDHSLEALQAGLDLLGSSVGGDDAVAIVPAGVVIAGNGGPPGELSVSPELRPVSSIVSLLRGRSPPAA